MTWDAKNKTGDETAKIRWELVPYTRGKGLDIGCGPYKAFPHFIGVDNKKDVELFKIQFMPDVVAEATDLSTFADGGMDFIYSSHTLEHIENTRATLQEWWKKIKVDGHLILYLPHKKLYPNIGTKNANPDHKHDFMPQEIVEHMKQLGSWDLLRNEDRDQDEEYSFFQVYKKLAKGGGQKFSYSKPRPKVKRAAVVRYGAWGDGLQASSILPALKAQGYHITFYTTPRCISAIEEDPNVDEWYIQDTDQVPNSLLGYFWDWEKPKYDKWINLSESVESTWLAIEERTPHAWPHSVRHKYLNENYIEFAHEVAGVPYTKPMVKFYPTIEERNKAFDWKKRIGGDPLIVWILAGSSIHKVWPHIDWVLAQLAVNYPKCKVVTMGDEKCRRIEDTKPDPKVPGASLDWDRCSHVIKASGRAHIRETLALAQVADIVIGPETGVLSGMSMESMAKIIFLSHSSHENLTRDWVNTYALFSTKTPCYPCHQLHHTWKHCHESKIVPGVAECQHDIPPQACWAAIQKALGEKVSKVIPMKAIA